MSDVQDRQDGGTPLEIEVEGLRKLKAASAKHELDAFIGWDPHDGDIDP